MKKLMFAAALAASAAAFADPINSIGFAGYDLGATFTNGQAEKDESGQQKAATYGYFCFYGDSDSSVVTNENPSTTKHTAAFEEAEDANYLALDTEGGTLWRSIETLNRYPTGVENEYVYSNGNARAVAATGTYLDTLVQFTVTEDDEPDVGTDDKLAIWLGINTNGVETTTNLMVKAAVVEGASRTKTTFTVTNAVVEPGVWYRLTVKAYNDITDGGEIPGFQIFLDGNVLASDTVTLAGSTLSELSPEGEFDDPNYPDIVAGMYFASLVANTTLQGVGFQGTGAVDEIVWTDDDPLQSSGTVDFTLTYTAGDANVTLGAVTYTVGAGEAQPVTFSEGAAQIPEGASVSIAEPTYATGYKLASLTTNGTAVAEASFPFTFTMNAAMTVAITAEEIPAEEDWVDNPATEITAGDTAATAYPGLADSALATADAQKLTIWAKAKGIDYDDIKNDTTGTYVEAYLLNCAVADVEDEKEAFKANITIGANGTPVVTPTTANTDGDDYNGTPQLQGKVNLNESWTNVNEASTTYKFYRYTLSL